MPKFRAATALVAAALTLGAGTAMLAQSARTTPAQDKNLPPLSYTCPMHPEIVEDKKGSCPICKMTLVPIRLDSVWTCLTKPLAVIETKPGRCPIDGTPLVQMTASVVWTCPGTDVTSVNPGKCADGSAMEKKYEPRAHGNHNPQHGGMFFMASDNWHHLEGTYLPSGIFRLHLYDDFTKPLPVADVRAMKADVVVKDPTTGAEKTVPLVRSGRTLQANIGKLPLPVSMYAKVQFKPNDKSNRFDFTFDSYSKEPPRGAVLTNAAPGATPSAATPATATPAPAAAAGTAATATAAAPTSAPATPATLMPNSGGGIDPALVPTAIPDTVPEMVKELRTRTDQIRGLIEKGSFGSIYVPAFQAKDIALALDEHKGDLPAEKQKVVDPAIAKLVRSAYMLDAFGDLGNKEQITEAYAMFLAASKDITGAFPTQP